MAERDMGVCNGCERTYSFIVDADTGFCFNCEERQKRAKAKQAQDATQRRIDGQAKRTSKRKVKQREEWQIAIAESARQRAEERRRKREQRKAEQHQSK